MLDALKRLVRAEPVRVAAVVVAAVIALAEAFGVVLDEESVGEVVAQVLLILAGGEVARRKVTPTDRRRR
jgi:uncharacterized protein (DUF697 family)